MTLTVTSREKTPGVFILSPVGTIDINTYEILEKQADQILQTSPKVIVFDMQRVEYISSAGIRVVLKTKKALKKQEGKLVLVNLQPQIKKVFEIVNALPSQEIFSSIEELDRYLDHIQRSMAE
jgi:anti-anti-sigma factor